MADTYEKDLAQKTSLTASDYIRVVGSDNVSYKQLVSNVKSAMGVNTLELKMSYGNSIEMLNNVINSIGNGQPFIMSIYSNAVTSLLTNGASGAMAIQLFGSRKNATYTQYMLTIQDSQDTYIGTYNVVAGTVSYVYKMPTRSEIDALTTPVAVTPTAGTNVEIDTNKSYKCGRTLFLNVKGHVTAGVYNSVLFTFAGATANPAQITFGIPTGEVWAVNGMAYGYINTNSVVGTIPTSGTYFHIAQAFMCNL